MQDFTQPHHDVSRVVFGSAPTISIPHNGITLGYKAKTTGCSVGAAIRPSSILAAAARALTRGMTCADHSLRRQLAAQNGRCLGPLPLATSPITASCNALACQRCWPSGGGIVTISSIWGMTSPQVPVSVVGGDKRRICISELEGTLVYRMHTLRLLATGCPVPNITGVAPKG